jgi:hypothetical protein
MAGFACLIVPGQHLLVKHASCLPAAQRYQTMPAIDRWVLDHTLSTLEPYAGVLTRCGIKIPLNLTGYSLRDTQFVEYLLTRVKGSQLMKRLREVGCGVALDDFGTGTTTSNGLVRLCDDSTRMGAPGWVMIGDAFAFLDPVFSSGVYLAMSGAEQAARVVDVALREPRLEARLLRKLEKRQRAGMARFAFFIYRFNGPIMGSLFRRPRNVLQIEQGVISMLAGDLFDSTKGVRRLWLFKFIYAMTALRHFVRWRTEHRCRMEQARVQFSGGTTPEDPR